MADLIIGGETFRVEVDGDPTRPAVLLSHSLGVDLSMWETQLPALLKHFRVIRYDTRGHGGTDLGDAPVSIARLGRDALAILDALEIETAHFLGLSMGGAVGLWLLANAPERIERAVLANTAPKLGTPETWNARITSVLGHGMTETAAATIERWFSPAFAGAHPQVVGAIRAQLEQISPANYAACCAALRDMDLRASLPTIRHDVLVISGRDDPVVPPDQAAAFAAQLPGGRHATLEARHLSNIEAAAAFDTAVTSFLTSRAKPRATARRPAARRPVPAKIAPVKRPAVSRRTTAARVPLKETVRTPVKKTPPVPSTARTVTKRGPSKVGAARRGAIKPAVKPVAKAPPKPLTKTVTKALAPARAARPAAKAVAKKAAPKKRAAAGATKRTPAKTATRRPAPLVRARGPVAKTPATKARAKAAAKAPNKKTTVKKAARKAPAPRRKPATKPRRPSGRRKT